MKSWKLLPLLIILLALSGCSRPPVPLSEKDLGALGSVLQQIDKMPDSAIVGHIEDWRDQAEKPETRRNAAEAGRLHFLIGYAYERRGRYPDAEDSYKKTGNSPYLYMAQFRIGEIARLEQRDNKKASGAYSRADPRSSTIEGWIRVSRADPSRSILVSSSGGELVLRPMQAEAYKRLDAIYRDTFLYQLIDTVVRWLGDSKRYSYGLALIVLALVVKIVTTPLTNMSMKSMRRMQALQPLLKELQEKYKEDRQALAREQWAMMRKHKVNPMGGCLPMLIQAPILIVMYRAIQHYIYPLSTARFLWVGSLAQPDMPLLLLYAFSMYVSQKLTTMPTADPQQQQMQRTMMWMMPVLFATMLSTLPSALILYWFAYNVFFTAHQYFMMRQPAPVLQAEQGPTTSGPPPRLRSKKKKR